MRIVVAFAHTRGIKKENGEETILMSLIGIEMIVNTDIDIDIADRKNFLQCIKNTPAMMNSKGKEQKHNTGVYQRTIHTQNCTVDFKKAEELGYFKLDIPKCKCI